MSLSNVTRVLIVAGTVLFTTLADKLTFTALWAQGFMFLSSHFQQQAIYNMFVNFVHLQYVFPLSSTNKLLTITVTSHSTITISHFRTRLCIHLTFWRRNYFFNFSTLCILSVNNTGTKYIRFMKQTAF